MNPQLYGQLTVEKGRKNIKWEKISSKNSVGKTGQQNANETGSLLRTKHKNKFKWIKDLNVRPETIKILEESTGSNLSDIGYNNIFLDIFPEAREIKAKINYWDLIKIESFCTAKETINIPKRQPTELEKIFTNDI